jgi:oligopeptide/dipeptide ABC transporter ATP-binding protein
MLEVSDLMVRYGTGRDALTAADRVSFAVPAGGTLGLVGESGSGKSTVGRALVGLLPTIGGTIKLAGQDVSRDKDRQTIWYRRRVQMVFQDPYASLNPRMTVGATINEALSMREDMRGRAERRAEAERVLELVGLSRSAMGRYPHQFSGGQRQRIALARALSVRPEVIVMDEVTSALDVGVQATILNLLKDLQRKLGLSYVFISHDLSVIGAMSDQVAVMYLGRIVETAEPDELFTRPRHPYTRALITSVPQFGSVRRPAPLTGDLPDPRRAIPGCRFSTRCPIGPLAHPERTICTEQDPREVAAQNKHLAACHFAGELEDNGLSTISAGGS